MFGRLTLWLHLAAALAGLAGGAFASAQFYENWIVPNREETAAAHARDLQQAEDARVAAVSAAAAIAADRRRQALAAEAAEAAYRNEIAAREARRVQEIETLEMENRTYARQLEAMGASCPLDDDTRQWLLDNRKQGPD